MTGIQYVTDENGQKIAVQIDLAIHGDAVRDFLEDLDDIRIIEERRDDPTVPYEDVRARLIAKGKL